MIDLSGAKHLVAGFEDQRWRAHEHGIDPLKDIADKLPGNQENGDGDGAENFLFIGEVDLINPRSLRDSNVEEEFLRAFIMSSHVYLPPFAYIKRPILKNIS